MRRIVGFTFAIAAVAHETKRHGARTGPSFASSSIRNDYIAFFRDAVLNRECNIIPTMSVFALQSLSFICNLTNSRMFEPDSCRVI